MVKFGSDKDRNYGRSFFYENNLQNVGTAPWNCWIGFISFGKNLKPEKLRQQVHGGWPGHLLCIDLNGKTSKVGVQTM